MMNLLKVIGQKMEDSGLVHVWTEANLVGQTTAEKVMSGKDYAKGIRCHKLTLQAVWQILLPQFLTYLQENDTQLSHRLTSEL